MCNKNNSENENDLILFAKVKDALVKLCEDNPDVIEYQKMKNLLKQASSFEELSKLRKQIKH